MNHQFKIIVDNEWGTLLQWRHRYALDENWWTYPDSFVQCYTCGHHGSYTRRELEMNDGKIVCYRCNHAIENIMRFPFPGGMTPMKIVRSPFIVNVINLCEN
jgi:hypothetical protein